MTACVDSTQGERKRIKFQGVHAVEPVVSSSTALRSEGCVLILGGLYCSGTFVM